MERFRTFASICSFLAAVGFTYLMFFYVGDPEQKTTAIIYAACTVFSLISGVAWLFRPRRRTVHLHMDLSEVRSQTTLQGAIDEIERLSGYTNVKPKKP